MPRPADRRDEQTWVTLELTSQGFQRAEEGTLAEDILDLLGAPFHWPVFVPSRTYTKGHKRYTVHLVDGYAFVGTGYEDRRYFDLEHTGSKYIKKVLSTETVRGIRVLHTLKNSVIEDWRSMLRDECSSDLKKGAYVTIVEGRFKNLDAKVLWIDGEYADVEINLRSLTGITRLPRYFLDIQQTPL